MSDNVRKALAAATVIVIGIGYLATRKPDPPADFADARLFANGDNLTGTLAEVGDEPATAIKTQQVRAAVRMRSTWRSSGARNFERFKESEALTLRSRTLLSAVIAREDARRQPLLAEADDKARVIEDRLKLRWDSPEILTVMLDGDDTDQLKAILSAFVNEYIKRAAEEERSEAVHNRAEIATALQLLDARIDERRGADAKLPGGEEAEIVFCQDRLVAATRRAQQYQTRKTELETQRKQLQNEEANGEPPVPDEALVAAIDKHPTVLVRRQATEELLKSVTELRAKLVAGSPRLAEEERKYRQAAGAVETERKALREKLLPELRARRKADIAEELKRLGDELAIATARLIATEKERHEFGARLDELTKTLLLPGEREELEALIAQRDALVQHKVQAEFVGKEEPRITLVEAAHAYPDRNAPPRRILKISVLRADGTERTVRVVADTTTRVNGGGPSRLSAIPTGARVAMRLKPQTAVRDFPEVAELQVIDTP